MQGDTISAISTASGEGGVGIVRVSGPAASQILACLSGKDHAAFLPRQLYLHQLHDQDGRLLDEALVTFMPGPHSYTAEDVAEFQLHGGNRVLRSVLAATLAAGARLAEPGEFTLRAFLNGRLALSQAEAVMDLIGAKTAPAAEQAAGQLAGSLATRIAAMEEKLLDLLASIVVGVDFPDDMDAPENVELLQAIEKLEAETAALLATADSGRILREGVRVALLGGVNVGKSSLLNLLLSTDRAIVTDLPGTTRDVIEEAVDIRGVAFLLADTAGFRNAAEADQVEQIGMARSRSVLSSAQLLLLLIDAAAGLDETARGLLQDTAGRKRLLVLNKCDLLAEAEIAALAQQVREAGAADERLVYLSAKTGAGFADLQEAMLSAVDGGKEAALQPALVSNVRHQQALLRVATHLREARHGLISDVPVDIAAIDLEEASSALGEISGRTVSEEVLANIFSRFCVGK